MKLLLAPWGDPQNWRKITYEFKGEKVESNTSLKILQEVVKPNKTVIIGLDTLAEKGSNYDEVLRDANEKISRYADEFDLKNYEVLVAPGIGSFPNGIFIGDALDYYYYTIAKISQILLDCNCDELEIHLDLTHGLNFSTILTYRLVKEILEIFSIFKNIKFKAYNADPSLPATTDKLSINIIEEVKMFPRAFGSGLKKERILEPINLSADERRKLFEEDLKFIRELNREEILAFLGSLYNGLPLALFTFYPNKNILESMISKTFRVYIEYIKVNYTNKLELRRMLRFGEDFKVYLFAYLTAKLLESLNIVSRKKEVTLQEIKNISSTLFKFDERFKNRIEDDIYTLEKDIKDREVIDWKIYNEILGRPIGEPDSRNFLAHSGFERNIVELKKNEDVHIRYREKKIRTVISFCQKGLK